MRNIALIISYDGAGYFGYQTQNGFITIQQVMEETISKMTLRMGLYLQAWTKKVLHRYRKRLKEY